MSVSGVGNNSNGVSPWYKKMTPSTKHVLIEQKLDTDDHVNINVDPNIDPQKTAQIPDDFAKSNFVASDYVVRGLAHYQLGEYEAAVKDFTSALKLNPNYADAYYNRGLAQYKLNEYEKAIKDLDVAIKFNMLKKNEQVKNDPESAKDLNDDTSKALADAWYYRGNAYKALGEANRDAYEMHRTHGSGKLSTNQLNSAINSYNRAIQYGGNRPEYLNNQAKALNKLEGNDHYLLAVDNANILLENSPISDPNKLTLDQITALQNRGYAYTKLMQNAIDQDKKALYKDLAIKDFNILINSKSTPVPSSAYLELANVYYLSGRSHEKASKIEWGKWGKEEHDLALNDFNAAIDNYKEALRSSPDNPRLYYAIGLAYSARGSALKDSIEYATEKADKDACKAKANEDFNSAITAFTDAINNNPKDIESYYCMRGDVYSKMHEHENAVKDYTTAIGKSSTPEPIYIQRGKEYKKSGKTVQALQDWAMRHTLRLERQLGGNDEI